MEKNKKQKNKIKSYKILLSKISGFTLIELMVSTSIFMVVMLIAMGSLVLTFDSAKKSNSLNFTMDNLSFAMESMTRSIRMGTHYYCLNSDPILEGEETNDCSGGHSISFIPAFGLSSNRFSYEKNGSKIQRCSNLGGCVDITSPNINIDIFNLYVRGSTIDNIIQPSVYMIVKGTITIKNQPSPFAIQTMISQRTFE